MVIGESEFPKTKILEQRRKRQKVIFGDLGATDNIFIFFFNSEAEVRGNRYYNIDLLVKVC